jgi:hypothetical protein
VRSGRLSGPRSWSRHVRRPSGTRLASPSQGELGRAARAPRPSAGARAGRAARPGPPPARAPTEVLLRRARLASVRPDHPVAGVLPDAPRCRREERCAASSRSTWMRSRFAARRCGLPPSFRR